MRGKQMLPITGRDIVILSTQDWDYSPTRKHHFARMFAAQGNRVLYVEQQMHWAGWLIDLRRQFSRAWRWLRGPRPVANGLWVYTLPLVLPFFQMSARINWLNNLFLLPVLKWQLRRLGFAAPILWAYTPHAADFVGRLGEQAAVYTCVDDFTSSRGLVSPDTIARLERRLIETVDLLITTAPALHESRRRYARQAALVPNGVDVEHFARAASANLAVPPAVADLPRPIVGFVGRINYWIDTGLLARIARAHPEWSLVLVGPTDLLAKMKPLRGLANVHVTGRVPYADVPAYVKAFDVCVNPYLADGVAEHCSPLKLYEYVASGKPVVSVDMPAAHTFEGLVEIAADADEFLPLLERVVAAPDKRSGARMAAAREHTWQRRFEAVCAALAEILSEREQL